MKRRASTLSRLTGGRLVPLLRRLPPAAALTLALIAGGCGSEDAVPIDPDNPPTVLDEAEIESPDVSHPIEPTEEMQEIARRQCLDDPDKTEGYVRAVDPDSGEVFAEFSVDCSEVRGE